MHSKAKAWRVQSTYSLPCTWPRKALVCAGCVEAWFFQGEKEKGGCVVFFLYNNREMIVITTSHAKTSTLIFRLAKRIRFTSTNCKSTQKPSVQLADTNRGLLGTDNNFRCVQRFTRQNFMDQPNVILLTFREFLLDRIVFRVDFNLGSTQQVPLSFDPAETHQWDDHETGEEYCVAKIKLTWKQRWSQADNFCTRRASLKSLLYRQRLPFL